MDTLMSSLPDTHSPATRFVLKEVIAASALATALYDCTTLRQAISTLYLYIEKRVDANRIISVADYVKEILDVDILHPQTLDDDDEDDPLPAWLTSLKSLRTNWRSVSGNSAFKQVSNLLSMASALGLCDAAHLKFDVNGIRIFSIPMYKKHITAMDFMDAAFDTALYFLEGGYKCFQTGTLEPFIFSNDEARLFDQTYFELCDIAPFMKTGTMEQKKGVSENDFDHKLSKAIEKSETLYYAAEGSFEKGVIHARMMRLRAIRADFLAIRSDGKLREAPYGVYIWGEPGVGKSTISSVLMRVILQANGYSAADERIITINESDKFEPTFKGFINGVTIDDWGQTKSNFVDKSPVEKIFELVNNVAAYANMPEADLKGKIPKTPKAVVANGNTTAYIVAGKYTVSSAAAVRRFLSHIEVRVKKEFALPDGRLDSDKVLEHYGGELPPVPDLWDLQVYRPDTKNSPTYLESEPVAMTLPECIRRIVKDSRLHFARQAKVVQYGANLDEKLGSCETCHLPTCMCTCTPTLENQALTYEDARTQVRQLVAEVSALSSPWLTWTNYVPDYVFDNSKFDFVIAFLKRRQIWNETHNAFTMWKGATLLSLLSTLMWGVFGVFMIIPATWLYIRTLIRRKREIIMQLRDMNGAMPELFKRVRDNHVHYIAATGTTLGLVYLLIRAYRSFRQLNDQGTLSPKSFADIKARDAEVSPWADIVVERPKATKRAETIHNMDEFKNFIRNNVVYVELQDSESTRFSNAFLYKSNVVIVPRHMFKSDKALMTIYRKGKESRANGTTYTSHVDLSVQSAILGEDLVMVTFDSAPPFKDVSSVISLAQHRDTPAVLFHMDDQGTYYSHKIYARKGTVRTRAAVFDGYTYLVEAGTFDGMCMAPIISDTVSRQIIGFHLGGLGKKGGAASVTAEQLSHCYDDLMKKPLSLNLPSKGKVLEEQYGQKFYTGEVIHPKEPVNFLPESNALTVYGTCTGRQKTHSSVIRTPISDIVHEVTGQRNVWGPPQFHSWKPWQASLEHSSKPSIGIEVALVARAVDDYQQPLIDIIKENQPLRETMRKLTPMENVCGRDGERFIDALKPNTSVGFPLSGAKSAYLTDLDPAQYEEFNSPRELDQQFWDAVDEMREVYRRGERNHPIFKACLKDEPTPIDKEKVRVFQAAPLAFQLLIREYYLPVARILSLYPLISECAVGVNAQGPEWNELRRHVTKYGEDRILAGDYSKYDLRMPAQLVKAAFKVLINLAKATGNYTDDDILIMEGIASDVAYPVMAYNGILLELAGSNPSGQNLTVFINSIANSILMRCACFDIVEERKLGQTLFREIAAMLTYGDDVKGSVKEGFDEFNHLSYAAFLAERDMKFTMPDKTSTPTRYMNDADADFLKRKNVWCSEVEMYMGALDEMSIFKSLHSVLLSTAVSPLEVSAMNVDGALREWFAHGREKYETRRAQMIEVAQQAEITHMCSNLDKDYDYMLTQFALKYDVEILDSQCGVKPPATSAEIETYCRLLAYKENMQKKGYTDNKTYRKTLRRLNNLELAVDFEDAPLVAQVGNYELSRKAPFENEDEQLAYAKRYFETMGFYCVGINIPAFGTPCIGEIDGLFRYDNPDGDPVVFILLEAKLTKQSRQKGIAQLGKYGLALATLQSTSHIRTVLMTGDEFEHIGDFGVSNFPFPPEIE